MLTNKTLFSNKNLLNLLISLIPLSLIIGNLVTNVNIILICVIGIIVYKFQIFNIKQKIFQYLIYSFFLYLILITLTKNLPNLNIDPLVVDGKIIEINVLYKEHIIKSFLFLRYLLLFLIINKMLEEEIFNIKLFFVISAILSVIVATNIILISFLEKSFPNDLNISQFFNIYSDQKLSGGFIQKFSFFFIFISSLFALNFKNKKIFLIYFFSIVFFIISIALSGSRMPLLIYLASLCFIVLIEKKLRKFIPILFFIFSVLIITFIKFAPETVLKKGLLSFYGNTTEIMRLAPKLFYYGTLDQQINFAGGYLVTFNSGVQTWKENKIFGSGLKSFRLNCKEGGKAAVWKVYKFQTCNTHTHNYFIELLVDTGIVGVVLIYLIFLIALYKFIRMYSKNLHLRNKSMPFFLIIFFEFFPLRSSGSFFTTNNATVIFLMLAIFINV